MLRGLLGVTVCLSVALAGCGGGSTKSSLAPRSGRECSTVSTDDVGKLLGNPAQVRALGSGPGQPITCGSMFFDSSGAIVVVVTQFQGGAVTLRGLRRSDATAQGSTRPLPALGADAFRAGKRVVVFRHGDTVVRIEAGVAASGSGALTPAQLEALGKTVEAHL